VEIYLHSFICLHVVQMDKLFAETDGITVFHKLCCYQQLLSSAKMVTAVPTQRCTHMLSSFVHIMYHKL
jgi:hypothetical protein